ncbi:MAG: hypothetical protein KAR06_06590 [Deltaproteobacteria bacterium]|nr:hypothetical protein [Deltaproteobacteria bacterium]
MTDTIKEENFSSGLAHYKKGNIDKAAICFEKAYKSDKEDPLTMSYYGLCIALRWGKVGLGQELCTKAIKKDYSQSIFYLNLSKIYMATGNKKGALSILHKGLRFNPKSRELSSALTEAGARKPQFIPFLGRTNFLNRYLGIFFRKTIPGFLRTKPPLRSKDKEQGNKDTEKNAA